MNIYIKDYKSFLDKIFKNLKEVGFGEEEFLELDHVAYRTESDERYEELKKEFEKITVTSSEATISGRLITVYRLKEPLVYGNWEVPGLELCAPKEGSFRKEGLEHAEFVTKDSLEKFMERHRDLSFNMKAFKKEVNRELILEFDDCVAKFHEQSLLEIRQL